MPSESKHAAIGVKQNWTFSLKADTLKIRWTNSLQTMMTAMAVIQRKSTRKVPMSMDLERCSMRAVIMEWAPWRQWLHRFRTSRTGIRSGWRALKTGRTVRREWRIRKMRKSMNCRSNRDGICWIRKTWNGCIQNAEIGAKWKRTGHLKSRCPWKSSLNMNAENGKSD